MLDKARQIMARLRAANAREVLFVGGFVRDHLMGVSSKDIDIEVYGLSYSQIAAALSPHYAVDFVGKSFGVLKVDQTIDVSIPRRERKTGTKHREFEVASDPNMTPMEAGLRRDFTINALMMSAAGEVLDYFGGQDDLRAKVLRAVSPAFAEDSLRVLRAVQFAARFDMSLDADTAAMCRSLLPEYDDLAGDRIFEEWRKWATKSIKPSCGLEVLRATGWDAPHPIFAQLEATEQDPGWHPEGNVWLHTMYVCDAAAEVAAREGLPEEERAILLFAALCHDLGKATTTVRNAEGRWSAPDHAEAGVEPTREFLRRIGAPNFLHEHVPPLVREHMAHTSVPEPTARVIRRLALRLAPSNLKTWSHLVEADHSGRPPKPKLNPVTHWMDSASSVLGADGGRPKPLLLGRHLLPLGWKPGPLLGETLRRAFEAQVDGAFSDVDGGLEWVARCEAKT